MATRENSISDSSQVDFSIFCPDIDQHDFEGTGSRISHQSQITPTGKSGFDREALAFFNVLTGRNENLPGGSNRRCSGDAWLESLTDSIGIEKRKLSEVYPVRSREGSLTRAICASNNSESGVIHRLDDECPGCGFFGCSARISCKW
jgi:hypothetical protein